VILVVVVEYVVAVADDGLGRHRLELGEKQKASLVSSGGTVDLGMGEEASSAMVLSHGAKVLIRHRHRRRPYLCPSP